MRAGVFLRSMGMLAVCAAIGSQANAQAVDQAQQAVQQGVQASGHASASAAHSVAASGQLTSAVLAVPLGSAGAALTSAGGVSLGGAAVMSDLAKQPIGTPLPVATETLTIMPPNQALQPKKTAP